MCLGQGEVARAIGPVSVRPTYEQQATIRYGKISTQLFEPVWGGGDGRAGFDGPGFAVTRPGPPICLSCEIVPGVVWCRPGARFKTGFGGSSGSGGSGGCGWSGAVSLVC